MKMTRFSSWLGSLLLVLVISSCQDHRLEPLTSPSRLKRFAAQSRRAYTSYALNYNSSGRLTSYVFRSASSPDIEKSDGQTNLLSYDGQGRLTSVEAQPSSASLARRRRDYEYDGNNNITVIREYIAVQPTDPFTPNATTTIIYNGNKLPAKVTRVDGTGTYENVYSYSNGNIVKIEYTASGTNPVTYNFQFDDKPNPLHGLAALAIYGIGETGINNNNSISADDKYTYNSNGLLTTVNIRYKEDSQFQGLITYEYE